MENSKRVELPLFLCSNNSKLEYMHACINVAATALCVSTCSPKSLDPCISAGFVLIVVLLELITLPCFCYPKAVLANVVCLHHCVLCRLEQKRLGDELNNISRAIEVKEEQYQRVVDSSGQVEMVKAQYEKMLKDLNQDRSKLQKERMELVQVWCEPAKMRHLSLASAFAFFSVLLHVQSVQTKDILSKETLCVCCASRALNLQKHTHYILIACYLLQMSFPTLRK